MLITGGGGQLADRLLATAPYGVEPIALSRAELDVAEASQIRSACERLRPEAIVNAAAYTAVDRAETEQAAAHAANALGPQLLAEAAAEHRARLIHISTDFVFDGSATRPYPPDHAVNPICEYGRSKAAGEAAVRGRLGDDALIVRTAWLYASRARNFMTTMLRLMREHGRVRVVADQVGTPTSAGSLADALWRALALPRLGGTHHFTDAGEASWYEFAAAIAAEARAAGLLEREITVEPIRTIDYPTPARRPAYSVLDRSSFIAATGLAPGDWRVALKAEVRRLQDA